MLYLENKLLEYMNINDEKKAIRTFNQLFLKFISMNSDSHGYIRNTKNYLISLNGIIANNYYTRPVCKKMIYNARDSFMHKIDSCRTIEELRKLGETIVYFYIREIKSKKLLTKNPTINKAINYIHNNLDKELTLDEVSSNVYVSSTYLSHLFSKCIKMTFSQYIIHARIQKSKHYLSNTTMSIMDIALECGFNSQSYFSNVFKKLEARTPKEYREEF